MPVAASHQGACISIEEMQSDLKEWGYRGDIPRSCEGEKAVELAPAFEPPVGLTFDAIVSLEIEEVSYLVVVIHEGCMADWRIYTVAGKI